MARKMTPELEGFLQQMAAIKSIAEHDSKMDDIGEAWGDTAMAEKYKRQFRMMVKTVMRRTGLTEEQAAQGCAEWTYGRLLLTSTDGETQRG